MLEMILKRRTKYVETGKHDLINTTLAIITGIFMAICLIYNYFLRDSANGTIFSILMVFAFLLFVLDNFLLSRVFMNMLVKHNKIETKQENYEITSIAINENEPVSKSKHILPLLVQQEGNIFKLNQNFGINKNVYFLGLNLSLPHLRPDFLTSVKNQIDNVKEANVTTMVVRITIYKYQDFIIEKQLLSVVTNNDYKEINQSKLQTLNQKSNEPQDIINMKPMSED